MQRRPARRACSGLALASVTLLAACPAAIGEGDLCTARLIVRMPAASPLESAGGRADVARVSIWQDGAEAFDQSVDLAGADEQGVVPVVDLRTAERPPLLASDAMQVFVHAYSSTSSLIYATGQTEQFACRGNVEVEVPLYLGPASAFAETAAVPGPRAGAAAVALDDGRVLVFGGETVSGEAASPSAFLYDHRTGTLCADCVDDPPAGRVEHTLTRLSDGSVAVIGGRLAGEEALAGDVLVFDPAAATFTALGASVARRGHASTLIEGSNAPSDLVGSVLIVGGEDEGGLLASLVLVDAAAPSVETLAAALSVARRDVAIALMTSGRVAITGGRGADGEPLAVLEYFDPKLRQVEGPSRPCPQAFDGEPLCARRAGHTATALMNGNVLLVGGDVLPLDPSAPVDDAPTAEVILLATEGALRATATSDAIPGRVGHAAIAIGCELAPCPILVVGGVVPGGASPASPALFTPPSADPSGDATFYPGAAVVFTRLSDAALRVGHAAAVLSDGAALIVGGRAPDGTIDLERAAVYSSCTVPEPSQLSCPAP